MAFYLKKTKLKGRTYLSIDESFYHPDRKGTAHKCYKSLGSVETLMKNGMEDPIAHFQKEVDELNRVRKEEGVKKISKDAPFHHLGYFPLKAILEHLDVKKYINYFNLTYDFQYDLFSVLAALCYARAVHPCSKQKTFHDVLPSLFEGIDFSYDQMLDALCFMGENYEKFIEIFTAMTHEKYAVDTSKTYFDCTNFYFEIDREDDFRRKGPSKENRTEPIVGMGLLLDKNQIPVGMKLYPGNESEKPVMRNVIHTLKKQNHIVGRTIHVADKGLNCAENIAFAGRSGDGYLFSKSVKTLPAIEKEWVLLNQDYVDVKDADGKLLFRYKSCVDDFSYTVTREGKRYTRTVKEKRLVTYNPSLAAKKKYEINKLIQKALALTASQAKKKEYGEAGKYVLFTDDQGKTASVTMNTKAIEQDYALAGYNLLVTSEVDMQPLDIYQTYHNLWRMEESFRIMKSDLDARPVYLQKRESIQGHFLICYITVLLERLLQFQLLNNQHSSSEIFSFLHNFNVVKAESKYINTSRDNAFIQALEAKTGLPLTNYFLSKTQIKSILTYRP